MYVPTLLVDLSHMVIKHFELLYLDASLEIVVRRFEAALVDQTLSLVVIIDQCFLRLEVLL